MGRHITAIVARRKSKKIIVTIIVLTSARTIDRSMGLALFAARYLILSGLYNAAVVYK